MAAADRASRSKQAVLAAVHDLLASAGLGGVSVDEISRRSGVAKTTIYRHWPSRSALLLDACATMSTSLAVPNTGSLRGDLLALAGEVAQQMRTAAWASVAPSIMDAGEHDPDLAQIQAQMHTRVVEPFRLVIERARSRGEIPAASDPTELVASILGPLFYRRWMSREPMEPAFAESLVDRALRGSFG
jgi:AcrR family transcriptional regulator